MLYLGYIISEQYKDKRTEASEAVQGNNLQYYYPFLTHHTHKKILSTLTQPLRMSSARSHSSEQCVRRKKEEKVNSPACSVSPTAQRLLYKEITRPDHTHSLPDYISF